MAKYYYNDVLLPEIPADVLAQYPYAWIRNNVASGQYQLLVGVNPWKAVGTSSVQCLGTIQAQWYNIPISSAGDATEWEFNNSGENSFGIDTNRTILWSNHDILKYNVSPDTVHFEGSEPVPEFPEVPPKLPRYSIASSILDGTARQIMRLTDSTEKVKPEEFEPKLEGINIQLQELTVVATEEVQTITPPSGVYGFSKVIVEAVEDSGSSGGGGTPGEGGDNPGGDTGEELYPPSDDMLFGYNFETTPEETGYSIYNGQRYPTIPCSLPYIILYRHYDVKAFAVDVPWTVDNYGSFVANGCHAKEEYTYDSSTETWTLTDSATYNPSDSGANVSIYSGVTVLWSNQDLVKPNGTYIMAGTTAEVETEGDYSGDYTPNDGTYTIEGSTLNELGGLIQKVTGTNEALSPAEMIEALKVLAGEETTE